MATRPVLLTFAVILALCTTAACEQVRYNPDLATRAYPRELHQTESIDIQVFRDGQYITVYNSTARSYENFDLWINQRYMTHVESLPAGGEVRLYLGDFWDEYGEAPVAGGLFRVDPPTPVVLVEIQPAPDEPLIGLIALRPEEVRQRE